MDADLESAPDTKLVILGLPWATTQASLEQYFSQLGSVKKATIMKDHISGRSRGFGFVIMGTKEEAEAIVKMSHELDGRRIEAKFALPKGETPGGEAPAGGGGGGGISSGSNQNNMGGGAPAGGTRIFVARVPPEVSDDAFRSYFEAYGDIQDSYMPKDHVTREHRGIGFVTFSRPDSVDRVMAEVHQLGGATVAVDRATPKDEPGGGGGGRGRGGGGGGGFRSAAPANGRPYGAAMGYNGVTQQAAYHGGGGGYGGYGVGAPGGPAMGYNGFGGGMMDMYGVQGGQQYAPMDPYGSGGGMAFAAAARYSAAAAPPQQQQQQQQRGGGDADGAGGKVFVGRLPADTTEGDLRDYFSTFGPLEDVYIPKAPHSAQHRGFGFVTFTSERTAIQVASMAHEIKGHAVAMDRAVPRKESDDTPPGAMAAAGPPGAGGYGPMDGYNAPAPMGMMQMPPYMNPNMYGGYGGGAQGMPSDGNDFAAFMAAQNGRGFVEGGYRPY